MSPANDLKEQGVNYQSELNAHSTGEFDRETFQPKSKFAQIKPPQEYTMQKNQSYERLASKSAERGRIRPQSSYVKMVKSGPGTV